jgi:hypothetical protein
MPVVACVKKLGRTTDSFGSGVAGGPRAVVRGQPLDTVTGLDPALYRMFPNGSVTVIL